MRARTALFKPGTTLSKLIGRIRFTIDVAEMTRRTRIDPRRGGGPVLPSLALEICIRYRFYYPQFPFYVSCCRSVDRSNLGVAIFNSIPGDPARRVPPEVSLISPDTLSRVNQRSPNSAERKGRATRLTSENQRLNQRIGSSANDQRRHFPDSSRGIAPISRVARVARIPLARGSPSRMQPSRCVRRDVSQSISNVRGGILGSLRPRARGRGNGGRGEKG